MKLNKKSPISILEVLIALSITALLLSMLFPYFHRFALCNNKLKKLQQEILPHHHVQQRISQIFDSLINDGYFFATKNELYFVIDHGIDPDPHFCELLHAQFHLNKKGEFVVRYFPNDEKTPLRTEILQANVKALSYEFYSAEDLKPTPEWEEDDLPFMMELTLKQADGKSTSWAFFFYSHYDFSKALLLKEKNPA